MEWVNLIRFGGLLDIPDSLGETRAQGEAVGIVVDLLNPQSKELERMNISRSIVEGNMPDNQGEALISEDFAVRFKVHVGNKVTLFGNTMNGAMMFSNFIVAGTVRFGVAMLDRGAVIIDLSDAHNILDMQDASGEILGFSNAGYYDDEQAARIKSSFHEAFLKADDELSPVMLRLRDQNGLDEYLKLADSMSFIMILVFVIAMSIVLWNTGLLGGLRRYTEYGIRLALGEEKSHIYSTTMIEAVLIVIMGSIGRYGFWTGFMRVFTN